MTTFLIVTFVILVLIGAIQSARNKLKITPSEAAKPAPKKRSGKAIAKQEPLVGDDWPEIGEFLYDVVGTSHYQRTLKSLVGDHGDRESKQIFRATITPESDNPHDPKAVRIDIDGNEVGYMARDDARSFRRRLGAKKMTDRVTFCSARIVGGYVRRSGERVSYGVRLDIKPFF